MTEHIWRVPIKTLGTSVYQYGEEACEGGHSFGPAVRDHFLLHFVTGGKGVFATEDKEYTVSAGEGFLISPDKVTAYRADAAEPWHYFWIGFSGESADLLLKEIGLSATTPVFSFHDTAALKSIFDRVHFLPEDSVKAQLALVSVLYALLSGIEAKREKSERGAYRLFHTGKEYADMAEKYGMDVETVKKYLTHDVVEDQIKSQKAIKVVTSSATVAAPAEEKAEESAEEAEKAE